MQHIKKPFAKLLSHSQTSPSMPSTTLDLSPDQPLTIVELFQSQGCNSCPPTNANLLALTQSPEPTPNILLLTYHVTYWDHLGWVDPFGQAANDQRQRDYVQRMRLRSAFTPQVIVNGRSSGVGNTRPSLNKVLQEGGVGSVMPVNVSVVPQSGSDEVVVAVSGAGNSSSGHKLHISLVSYDPMEAIVQVREGENAGKTLRQFNVVKDVKLLGQGTGGDEQVFVFERSRMLMKQVVVVQDGKGGPIVGAAVI